MSQARCTFKVCGLDCPNEVESLRSALQGQPGVTALGFDVVNGTMTVDYTEGAVDPRADRPTRSASELACMQQFWINPIRKHFHGGRGMGSWALIVGSGSGAGRGIGDRLVGAVAGPFRIASGPLGPHRLSVARSSWAGSGSFQERREV